MIFVGGKLFALTVGILGLLALKEMIDLRKSHTKIPAFMSLLFYLSLIVVIYISPFEFTNKLIDYRLLSILFFLYFVPTLFYYHKGVYKTSDAFYFLAVVLFFGIACHGLIMVRVRGLLFFLFLLSIPILTDSFAYIFGKLIGKHSLSKISPNKTWEGSICGTICATLISSGLYVFLVNAHFSWSTLSIIVLLSIASQVGDLFFSAIKRENEIKDFSNLIPEHGGILDRFDSVIFMIIVFLFFIPYL